MDAQENELDRLRRELDTLDRSHKDLAHRLAEAGRDNERLLSRAERLRLELEKIGWMDKFLDANGAKAMMNIAREAVNADESQQGR